MLGTSDDVTASPYAVLNEINMEWYLPRNETQNLDSSKSMVSIIPITCVGRLSSRCLNLKAPLAEYGYYSSMEEACFLRMGYLYQAEI